MEGQKILGTYIDNFFQVRSVKNFIIFWNLHTTMEDMLTMEKKRLDKIWLSLVRIVTLSLTSQLRK